MRGQPRILNCKLKLIRKIKITKECKNQNQNKKNKDRI